MSTYSAKRLPRQTGAAGWNAILPPQASLPVLEADLTADVTIIGGDLRACRPPAACTSWIRR